MDYQEIKQIIKGMEESKLDSLSIEFPDGIKISMTKSNGQKQIVSSESIIMSQEEVRSEVITNEETKKEDVGTIIYSPMVGTFYSSPAPDKAPYVKVGDKVIKGDTICIIEAMKLINEITAEADGEVAEIYVQNEEMVDFNKPLFRIV